MPGFPVGFGGMINMSMVDSMGQLHHAGPHPHHATSVVTGAPGPHHPAHPHHHQHHPHHPRLHAARASPAADDARSPGHSPRSPGLPGGAPPSQAPSQPTPTSTSMGGGGGHGAPRSDRYAPYNRLAQVQIHPPRNPNKPLTPFSISDILTGRAAAAAAQRRKAAQQDGGEKADRGGGRAAGGAPGAAPPQPANINYLGPLSIVRPWADASPANRLGSPVSDRCDESEEDSEEEIEVDDDPNQIKIKLKVNSAQSPLDALLQMTSKTFDGMDASAAQSDGM